MDSRNQEQPGPSGTATPSTSGQEEMNSQNALPYMNSDGEKEELIPNSGVWICKNIAEMLRNFPLHVSGLDVLQFLTEMLLKSLLGIANLNNIIANYSTTRDERRIELPTAVTSVIKEFIRMRYNEANRPSPFDLRSFDVYLQTIFTQSSQPSRLNLRGNQFFTRSSQPSPLRLNGNQVVPRSAPPNILTPTANRFFLELMQQPHAYRPNANGTSVSLPQVRVNQRQLSIVHDLLIQGSNPMWSGTSTNINTNSTARSTLTSSSSTSSRPSNGVNNNHPNSSSDISASPRTNAASNLLRVITPPTNESNTNHPTARSPSPASSTSSISSCSAELSPIKRPKKE